MTRKSAQNWEKIFRRAFVVDSHADSILDVVPSTIPLLFEYLRQYFHDEEEYKHVNSLLDSTVRYILDKSGAKVAAGTVDEKSSAGVRSLAKKSGVGHLDFPRMVEAGVDLEFLSVYTEHEYKYERAAHRALVLINEILNQVEEFGGLRLILSKGDLRKSVRNHEPSILISFEGGEPFEGEVGLVNAFYRLGVRCVGLTYNERNQIGDGLAEARTKSGLTEFGIQVVEEMNKLGMLIDVAHISEHTFYDVLDCTKRPIINSHANCYAIKKHLRNMKDDQLRALADSGGVVAILFGGAGLLTDAPTATTDDIVRHVAHAVEIAGVSHVGLGSDFDGTRKLPRGFKDVRDTGKVAQALLKHGFNEKETKMILGGNTVDLLLNVLK